MQNIILPLVVLTLLYGVIILGLVWLLRRVGISGRWAILLSFLFFGLGTGLAVAWIWPLDSSVYPNVWAAILGDALYRFSSDRQGSLWLLEVPHVYILAGALLFGGFGLLVQWLYNRTRSDGAKKNDYG